MHTALIPAICAFSELKNKEVVNLCDGGLLGCIGDLEINTCTGEITALIIPGNGLLASLSSKNRTVIPWRDIERIGKDTILVNYKHSDKNE